MQNVIEQSVLDNHWLPTAESTGSRAHQDIPLPMLSLILIIPHLVRLMSVIGNLVIEFIVAGSEIFYTKR